MTELQIVLKSKFIDHVCPACKEMWTVTMRNPSETVEPEELCPECDPRKFSSKMDF